MMEELETLAHPENQVVLDPQDPLDLLVRMEPLDLV